MLLKMFFTIAGHKGAPSDVSILLGRTPTKIHRKHPVLKDRQDFPEWEWTIEETRNGDVDVDDSVNTFIGSTVEPISRFGPKISEAGWSASLLCYIEPASLGAGLYLSKESVATLAKLSMDFGIDSQSSADGGNAPV
jgi:hypothetical protein